MIFLFTILFLISTNLVFAAPTERKITVAYTEPSFTACPPSTTLKPLSALNLAIQGLGSESQLKTLDRSKNQVFEMIAQNTTGQFQLQSVMTLQCLKIVDGTNGSKVIETTCGIGDKNQVFTIGPSPSPIEYTSGAGGQCLDVEGNKTADGTALQGWQCHGGDNQKFSYALSPGNDCPLDDLAGTNIYLDMISDGVGETKTKIDATALTGGGKISKTICLQIKDDQTVTRIDAEVTAFDLSGNESPRTEKVSVGVSPGGNDCSFIPDTTPPDKVEDLEVTDP